MRNLTTYGQVWVTSDQHFAHAKIIRYANRPYASAAEMDMDLIQKWNSVVAPGDIVLHLGDFCFGNINVGIVAKYAR
jgi:calcineurin-like phosphoesterase family protein